MSEGPPSSSLGWVERMRGWALAALLPSGRLPTGLATEAIGASLVVVVLDSKGRVFHVEGGVLRDARWRQVRNGRSAVLEAMDRLGTVDLPAGGGGSDD